MNKKQSIVFTLFVTISIGWLFSGLPSDTGNYFANVCGGVGLGWLVFGSGATLGILVQRALKRFIKQDEVLQSMLGFYVTLFYLGLLLLLFYFYHLDCLF